MSLSPTGTPAARTWLSTRWVSLIGALILLGGCAGGTAPPPSVDDADEDAIFDDEYRIGVGDSLRIDVWRNPDLSVEVPVRPDGRVSVPLAGDLRVGNRTPEEVSTMLQERLATYIRDPFVTVIVTDMGSAAYRSRVRVTGAVAEPLSLPYRQGMTVLDLVLEAGGLTEFARPNAAVLYRANGDRLDLRLGRMLSRGDMATNYSLSPGDVITVPERGF